MCSVICHVPFIVTINTLFTFIPSSLCQYVVHGSHLHTIRGRRASFVQALLGRHNHGRLYLVSAVAVRQNSSQVCWSVTLTLLKYEDPDLNHNKQMLTSGRFLLIYFALIFKVFLKS